MPAGKEILTLSRRFNPTLTTGTSGCTLHHFQYIPPLGTVQCFITFLNPDFLALCQKLELALLSVIGCAHSRSGGNFANELLQGPWLGRGLLATGNTTRMIPRWNHSTKCLIFLYWCSLPFWPFWKVKGWARFRYWLSWSDSAQKNQVTEEHHQGKRFYITWEFSPWDKTWN